MQPSILVVDDDAAIRDLVARIVRSWGHLVVSEAGSVTEALARAEALRLDVALQRLIGTGSAEAVEPG